MRKLKQRTTLILSAFILTTSWVSPSFAIEDAIIAVVNSELITLKDLKDYIQSTYVSLVAEGLSDQQIKDYMKDLEMNGTNKLIEDKLILSKANNVGIEVRQTLVDGKINDLVKKYGNEQNLVDALIKHGSTLTDLRNKILDELKIKYIIDHEVKPKIYVNPQEVTSYYEQNKEKFSEEGRINLSSIFLAYGNDKMATLKKAVELYKEIAMQKDFKELSIRYSDAPSIGIVKRGQLLPVIEKTVFSMRINQVSPLVEVDNGIWVFKLIGENQATTAKLNDVKDSIYDLLYKQKFKKQFLIWVENLKEDAYIEIKK